MNLPKVTIIMPVKNEGPFIRKSVSAVLAQEYPALLEILVVDGMSTDGTRETVAELVRNASNHRIQLLDNEAGWVPFALNKALEVARGDIIIRIDGHCVIPPDYVARCVQLLARTGAHCVGGRIENVGEGLSARANGLAQSSTFGVGSARFRTGGKEGPVDTVAFGAYVRGAFELAGEFDEELIRNQDDEFNFRLIQRGGLIWFDPELRVRYYNRGDLRSLFRQYFGYGKYKVRVIQKRGGVASWRHLVPALFVAGIATSALVSLWFQDLTFLVVVLGIYLVVTVMAALAIGWREPTTLLFLPLAFAAMHSGYGLGFLSGLWRWRGGWRSDA